MLNKRVIHWSSGERRWWVDKILRGMQIRRKLRWKSNWITQGIEWWIIRNSMHQISIQSPLVPFRCPRFRRIALLGQVLTRDSALTTGSWFSYKKCSAFHFLLHVHLNIQCQCLRQVQIFKLRRWKVGCHPSFTTRRITLMWCGKEFGGAKFLHCIMSASCKMRGNHSSLSPMSISLSPFDGFYCLMLHQVAHRTNVFVMW